MTRVAAIILAAGASTRLGFPKQLVKWGGECLLDRAVRIANEAGCVPVVVLGAHAEAIHAGCHLNEARTIINPRWKDGMSTSIVAGVEGAQEFAEALILMTCDQPAVTSTHVQELIAHGARTEGPVASAYAGRNGIPAYFPAAYFGLLLGLRGNSGARNLLVAAQSIPLTRGEMDIDTPERLLEAQGYFPGT